MPSAFSTTNTQEGKMKASTLIKELQSKIDEFGDIQVTFEGATRDVHVGDIVVYDKNGNEPKEIKDSFEIYLHAGGRVYRD